jgi:LPS-assembly protein
VQEREGPKYKLRGHVKIETTEMMLEADEVDYNEDTGEAEARGNVKFQHFTGGEEIQADKVEYNLQEETGKYYNVKGSSPAKIEARPGVLTTSNPFSFQGEWAEKMKDRYILHDGFITNCKLPKPWWILRGPVFDMVPGDRAIARSSTFLLRRVPLFYTPFFYKSLAKMPRRSGLLTPNIGNSSRRGMMIGAGY